MTCIVYRDGVIASDSQIVGRTWACQGTFKKIGHRDVDGKVYLYGAYGETAMCAKFNEWVQSEGFVAWLRDRSAAHPQIDPAKSDEVCVGLIFHPEGHCTRWEGNYPAYDITGEFFAFGSGDMVALGALGAGASAVEAIEITATYDVLTNGPVQSIDRNEMTRSLASFNVEAA